MDDYEAFKKQILNLTGIDLSLYKERQMKRRITTLSQKYGFRDYESFYQDLKQNAEHRKQFLNYLTINVSEYYRNPAQWKILEEKVIPELIAGNNKTLKIWSAACSTGDEPYTIMMMMREKFPKVSVKLLATDLDDEVLAYAKQGIYSEKSLLNLPKEYLHKYFKEIKPGQYQITKDIMNAVEFRQHNLLSDAYEKDYDLIVCRNVLIYFTDEAKLQVFKDFHKALRDNGYLFIGSTEQILQARAIHFEPQYSFFYKKVE